MPENIYKKSNAIRRGYMISAIVSVSIILSGLLLISLIAIVVSSGRSAHQRKNSLRFFDPSARGLDDQIGSWRD